MSEGQGNTESTEEKEVQTEESKEVEGSGPKPLFEETEEDKANRKAESDDKPADEESEEEESSEEDEESKKDDDESESDEDKKEDEDSKEEKDEEIKLSLPKESVLAEDALERIALFAKEQGLTKKQAQAIVNEQDTAIKSHIDIQQTEHEQKATVQWIEELKADKEIGGEHFNASLEHAKRAAKQFFPEAVPVLDETLYGNWPPLVKGFARIGKAMSDDSLVQPGAVPGGHKPMENIFYPENKE
jgi:hypothetical protein